MDPWCYWRLVTLCQLHQIGWIVPFVCPAGTKLCTTELRYSGMIRFPNVNTLTNLMVSTPWFHFMADDEIRSNFTAPAGARNHLPEPDNNHLHWEMLGIHVVNDSSNTYLDLVFEGTASGISKSGVSRRLSTKRTCSPFQVTIFLP